MFHCYLTYYRYLKAKNNTEGIAEQYHIEVEDEKTVRKVGCALSGLMQQMDIEHDINFVYVPDRRS